MGVTYDLSSREPAAIYNAGVVKFVRVNHILYSDKRGDCSNICTESRLKGDRCFNPFEGSKTLLKLDMKSHGAGDSSDSAGANTEVVDSLFGCLSYLWMVRKPKVIVGTEIQLSFSIDIQPGSLGRVQSTNVGVQAGLA